MILNKALRRLEEYDKDAPDHWSTQSWLISTSDWTFSSFHWISAKRSDGLDDATMVRLIKRIVASGKRRWRKCRFLRRSERPTSGTDNYQTWKDRHTISLVDSHFNGHKRVIAKLLGKHALTFFSTSIITYTHFRYFLSIIFPLKGKILQTMPFSIKLYCSKKDFWVRTFGYGLLMILKTLIFINQQRNKSYEFLTCLSPLQVFFNFF